VVVLVVATRVEEVVLVLPVGQVVQVVVQVMESLEA
jgi:hypothetical protein